MNNIFADEIIIGVGTIIDPTAVIRGVNGNAKKIVIGDYCYIGSNVQIICDEFSIGDYSKIQHDCNIHGYKPCIIGHNLWMGQFSIIDSIGGCTIGNNCGIGAHSQLWSHVKYGDTLEGCRFLSEGKLDIGNDVWFVGHCIVSPIKAKDKSMALVGSVVTKDMDENTIYSGVPAKPISDKIGNQFNDVSQQDKFIKLNGYLKEAKLNDSLIKIVIKNNEIKDDEFSYFVIEDRSYTKKGNPDEVKFMKYLLPEKAKFIPYNL
jgi:acetyltransferase-like isoleucine patch superfamily enzyme